MERTDAEEVSPVLIESVINRREGCKLLGNGTY